MRAQTIFHHIVLVEQHNDSYSFICHIFMIICIRSNQLTRTAACTIVRDSQNTKPLVSLSLTNGQWCRVKKVLLFFICWDLDFEVSFRKFDVLAFAYGSQDIRNLCNYCEHQQEADTGDGYWSVICEFPKPRDSTIHQSSRNPLFLNSRDPQLMQHRALCQLIKITIPITASFLFFEVLVQNGLTHLWN